MYIRGANNNKQFLLGRDTKYKCWSDFGGKYEQTDDSPDKTASREFYEETDGVFLSQYQILSLLDCPTTNSYKCFSYKNRSYLMFVVDITGSIPDGGRFQKIREQFKRIVNMLKVNDDEGEMYRFREKNDIGLFEIDYIVKNPGLFRSVFYNSFMNNLQSIENA